MKGKSGDYLNKKIGLTGFLNPAPTIL